MAEQQSIECAYVEAKNGNWKKLLTMWRYDKLLARKCSRYQKPTSGWTFLHQAAYFGNEEVCRELIRMGAAIDMLSHRRQSAADVAEERQFLSLAKLLRHAFYGAHELVELFHDPKVLPSSHLWNEAVERRAIEDIYVGYGYNIIKIPVGSRYFVDSFERTLIGWHGSYDPPLDMDLEPIGIIEKYYSKWK